MTHNLHSHRFPKPNHHLFINQPKTVRTWSITASFPNLLPQPPIAPSNSGPTRESQISSLAII